MKRSFPDIIFIGLLLVLFGGLFFIGEYSTFVPSIIAVISIYIALIQFRFKTTLDKVNYFNFNPEISDHVVNILKLEKEPIPDSTAKSYVEDNSELFSSIIYVLGMLDDIILAMNVGLIMKSLVEKSLGSFLIRTCNNCSPYIETIKKETGKEDSYKYLWNYYIKSKNKIK